MKKENINQEKIEKSEEISRSINQHMDVFNKEMKAAKTPKSIFSAIKNLFRKNKN